MYEIEHESPDVFCLVEVDNYHDYYMKEIANLGYRSKVLYRKVSPKDAALVAWNEKNYKLIDHMEVRYADLI